ncbi:OmpA family protein [Spongiimicrobium sp. 2-473A-2-J]|uniref:OmpA family protein n=1 Tax=Eudoraea algarum TaxID=3417568 RepID=UPI003D36D158
MHKHLPEIITDFFAFLVSISGIKKSIAILAFLLSLGISAQDVPQKGLLANPNTSGVVANTSSPTVKTEARDAASASTSIKSRTLHNLEGAKDGHYIISGVFGNKKNTKRVVKKLLNQGFNAGYIANPNNGLNYIYLERYTSEQEAMAAAKSQLYGRYIQEVWILHIENEVLESLEKETLEPVPEQTMPVEEVTYDMIQASQIDQNKAPIGSSGQNKLLEKADLYFNKMWYAEAAELYEEALGKGKRQQFSYDIVQRAGDAHYFNTNMEKAYYWYNVLYEQYQEEMSADNIFKFAHSLKGTGKYARAKRLMRLYNKKLKEGKVAYDPSKRARKEAVLDQIRGQEGLFEIKNLAINTKYSEFSPMFHEGNKMVYASAKDSSFFTTRRYKWNNQPYLDLYVAKINEESQEVKNAIKFSKKINTKYHEAAVTFSPDNKTMYFTRNNYGKKLKRDKNGINNLKIYTSTKVDGEWTEAREVPFNSDSYSTGHPALSPDGKLLYFVSDMPGSLGATDIFVVDVLSEGRFSEPRNLGPEINTEQKEMFPFINEKKLYFSSNGHVGLGGLDIYEAAYDEDGFQEVKNMGKPINSRRDDFSYIINEETQKGFFASNRKGGKGDDDIYSVARLIPEEVNENAIAGVVTEIITGEVMPEALVMLLDEHNMKLKEVVTDTDGSFVFEDLDSTTKYTIKTLKGSYFDDEQTITTKENELVNVSVSMKKLKELIVIEEGIKKLKTDLIYFDFDKFSIRRDASEELNKLVEVMAEYPDMVIKIESHTDSRGSRVYNKYLSDKRAKSSRDYLISKGVSPDRIESAIGYGEERLLNECDGTVRCSGQKHEFNRRSEFIIVRM